MADIQMRFHKDQLVLSSSVSSALERLGVDAQRDLEFMNLVEPDSVCDLLRMELTVGAQCLVLGTSHMTPAQLAQRSMEGRAEELRTAIFTVAKQLKSQHLLVELEPCGLPLDASSKASLNENRSQYAQAARVFEKESFDAYLLHDFDDVVDLKCALMGIRQVSDRPIFASVRVNADKTLPRRGTLSEAIQVMEEFETNVVGFICGEKSGTICELAKEMAATTHLPLLVEIAVAKRNDKQGMPTDKNPYYCADTMVDIASQLRACGVQFMRAIGDATPAYTGALAVATMGFDVKDRS